MRSNNNEQFLRFTCELSVKQDGTSINAAKKKPIKMSHNTDLLITGIHMEGPAVDCELTDR